MSRHPRADQPGYELDVIEAERDKAQALLVHADLIIMGLLACGPRPSDASIRAWIDDSREPILAAVERTEARTAEDHK